MEYLLVAGVVFAAAIIFVFNRIVRLGNRLKGAWSDVDVQLKRRWDLVPRLVAVAQGYTGFERTALEELTAARGVAATTAEGDIAGRSEAESRLTSGVKRVVALVEAYPELRASAQFTRLQTELVVLEKDLAHARDYYNAVARDFNTLVQSVPANLVAGAAGFGPADFFRADDSERTAPEVRLDQ